MIKPVRAIAALLAIGLLAASGCSERDAAAVPATGVQPVLMPATPLAAETLPAAVKNDSAVINFEGFGPAKFGGDEEQVRMSWGRPLQASTPAAGASCYQLFMDPMPEAGKGIVFLFEDGKFARYDVDMPQFTAPGDFGVGARAEDILAKFAGRIEVQAHKYVEGGRNLIVSPADGGAARLLFEVNADGVVSAWRIGVPPQIHYVEGCG